MTLRELLDQCGIDVSEYDRSYELDYTLSIVDCHGDVDESFALDIDHKKKRIVVS